MDRFTEQETTNSGSIITHPNNCGVMTHCVCEKDIFWKIVNKLKEYEDLEEQGKLLKLPCKVGDTVYITFRISEEFGGGELIEESSFDLDMVEEMGKTVFLTKEEAEAALREMNEKEGAENENRK